MSPFVRSTRFLLIATLFCGSGAIGCVGDATEAPAPTSAALDAPELKTRTLVMTGVVARGRDGATESSPRISAPATVEAVASPERTQSDSEDGPNPPHPWDSPTTAPDSPSGAAPASPH
jgi:hypothetical protein